MYANGNKLFYDKRYACTNLLMDESSIVTRDMIDNAEFEYVPNFVQLAEAYGAKAMRITKLEDIEKGFQLQILSKMDQPYLNLSFLQNLMFANGTSGQVFKRYVN